MIHVVWAQQETLQKFSLKYDDCYPKSYNDPYKPIEGKKEALQYSKSLGLDDKFSCHRDSEFARIYLTDCLGKHETGRQRRRPCSVVERTKMLQADGISTTPI